MNLIKRIKAPTPLKYKRLGKFFKWISGSLGAGMLAINSVALALPTTVNLVIGIAIFITATLSTACYAQIEEDGKDS